MKYLILATIVLSSMPCFSQVKANEKERTCRVVFLERPNGAPETAHIFDGATSHEVRLSTRNLSRVIKLHGSEGGMVLGMTPDPVPDPENFPKDAPTVKIPARMTDFYLVVVSDLKNKILPVRMLLVDASDGKLNTGETLWINFSKYRVAGKLGKESLMIPAKAKVVGKAPLRTSGYYEASFLYQPNSKSKFLPVMKKSWWFDATSKNLGFIINTGNKLPKIFMFRDRPVPKPAKDKNEE
jgi:hypothetical protein